MIGVAVDQGTAFTGRVDGKGGVASVASIDVKLRAACEKGVSRAYVPDADADQVPVEVRATLDVRLAKTLEQAVREVMGEEIVRDGLARLHATVRPPVTARRQEWLSRGADDGVRRVLLTFVGKADPNGRYLGRDRTPLQSGDDHDNEEKEGPTLTVARMLGPQAVYLLHTTGTGHDPNDFAENARATKRFLESEDAGLTVECVSLPGITDPSNYEEVVPALTEAIRKIQAKEAGATVRWFVNVSSGTPAMESTWHLLREWGRLDATLLQARERRFAKEPGAPRVREVVLPVPG